MPTHVPGAARALALFEVFADKRRELSNLELARLLDLPESSCSDLVSTLIECGYVERSTATRRLYPSSKLAQVAGRISQEDAVEKRLAEKAQLLRDRTGESTLCGNIEDGFVRVLAFSEGRYALRYSSSRGEKISLHVSALGKSILALLPPAQAEEQLRLRPLTKLAAGTLITHDALLTQIRRFRRQGYALVEGEGGEDLGALAIAAQLNGAFYAISIACPVGRLKLSLDGYLNTIREVSKDLFV